MSASPPRTTPNGDLFSTFSLSGFDSSTAPKSPLVTHYVRPTTVNTPPTILVSQTPSAMPATSSASPPPASRSLRSRFSLSRESPSSTPYTPHHLNRSSLHPTPPSASGALGLVKNPLRRRSAPKADEIAFAQRMEANGGLKQPPPFDPQYLGGVKPPVSMVSLAGTEVGWVSVPGEDRFKNAPALPAAVVAESPVVPAAGKGKGGPGWYAGKRKNDKGEIVAIGPDGVEVVIMKLPVKPVAQKPKEKEPSPRPSRTPSPHPPPLIPLPPIPTLASVPPAPKTETETALADELADDLPSTLIREILASSPSRANEGTGYFDVYKQRISEAGSIRSNDGEAVKKTETAPLEITKKSTAAETLSAPKSSHTIHEESEDDQNRTPMPASSAMFASFSHPSTPPAAIPKRKSSLPASPSLNSFRRPFAFGTRSPPPVTPRSGSMSDLQRRRYLGATGGIFDDSHLLPGSPVTPKKRYTIVAHSASDEEEAVEPKRRNSMVVPLSPQAWAERVAAEGEPAQQWDAKSSISEAEADGLSTRRASTSSSSSESIHSASGGGVIGLTNQHHHQDRHSSFSSSTESDSSSAPNSSFTLASTPSTYTSASAGSSSRVHTPTSSKGAKLHTATVVRVVPHTRMPTSTSLSSVEQKERSIQEQHTSALLFALSESTRSLSISREENLALRAEVAELRTAIDQIRIALLETQTNSGGSETGSVVGEVMSTLNSFASSRFPSLTSGGGSKWDAGGSDGGEEDEKEEGLGEMLLNLTMPMPPMRVPGEGLRRRGP